MSVLVLILNAAGILHFINTFLHLDVTRGKEEDDTEKAFCDKELVDWRIFGAGCVLGWDITLFLWRRCRCAFAGFVGRQKGGLRTKVMALLGLLSSRWIGAVYLALYLRLMVLYTLLLVVAAAEYPATQWWLLS